MKRKDPRATTTAVTCLSAPPQCYEWQRYRPSGYRIHGYLSVPSLRAFFPADLMAYCAERTAVFLLGQYERPTSGRLRLKLPSPRIKKKFAYFFFFFLNFLHLFFLLFIYFFFSNCGFAILYLECVHVTWNSRARNLSVAYRSRARPTERCPQDKRGLCSALMNKTFDNASLAVVYSSSRRIHATIAEENYIIHQREKVVW